MFGFRCCIMMPALTKHVPVVMGWIYYRCRRAGLGMIVVARTLVSTCVLRCVAFCNRCVDVLFSRFNTRRSKHYACCRHNYTSMATVQTPQNDLARFCFLAPFWGAIFRPRNQSPNAVHPLSRSIHQAGGPHTTISFPRSQQER